MKAKLYFSLMFICLCLCQSVSYSQCTDASYGQFPTSTFYCSNTDGTPEVIDESCYAGEFSVIHVDQGFTYEFSSSIATDYLTVVDDQLTPLTFGVSPVSYVAAFTGFVAFFTHVNASCDESEDFRSRIISCTDPGPCTNDAYGQYPLATFSSTICNGVTEEVIDTDCAAGEYSKVNLVAGNTYHFSSSESQDYITITNENGSSAIVYGYPSPSLEYVATTNQVVRFYLHTDHNCGVNMAFRSRIVKCGPTFCHGGYQWPEETYSMTACNGTVENIVNDAFAGEHALVNMEMNKTYVLSSSVLTDYITVASEDDAILYTRGTTPVTFSPPASGVYRFLITTNAECGSEEVNRDRNISCSLGGVGVEEQTLFGFILYPNPASTFVTVSSEEVIDEIQIVSVDGKVLSTVRPGSLSTSLSLEDLQVGTYFIRASVHGMTIISEVIKQ